MHLKALRFCSIEHLLKLRRDAPIHLHAVAAVREREAVALRQAAVAIHEGEVPGQIRSRVRRRVCERIDRHVLRPERQREHDEQNEREEADVRKLSDIMAVMGLAVVFVGIATFIACWG